MKKYLLSGVVIIAFIAYAIHYQNEGSDDVHVVAPKPAPSIAPTGQTASRSYKDGTYIGQNADAFYGNVQVNVTIASGQINNVSFLDYPKDRQTSVEINSQAMPLLTQEAISVQNAQVDIISGATQTSLAFRQSLQSALNQAKS